MRKNIIKCDLCNTIIVEDTYLKNSPLFVKTDKTFNGIETDIEGTSYDLCGDCARIAVQILYRLWKPNYEQGKALIRKLDSCKKELNNER